MRKLLCPSMMCVDVANLAADTAELDNAGADMFHIDVMDGLFVPNFALGTGDISCIRANTKKPLDVHLMIRNPSEYVELFVRLGADVIYFHPETDPQPARTLDAIKKLNKAPGIAINPGTSIEYVSELLNVCEYVLVMAVSPGFAGQEYLCYVTEKIRRIAELKEKYKVKIIVDGAMSKQKIIELGRMGIDGFVLGTSVLFGKSKPYNEVFKELREQYT